MNKDDLTEELEKIDRLVDDASDRALYIIKREARKILREDTNLEEFIMAMGSCFFSIKLGGKYDTASYTDEEWEVWCDSDEYVSTYYNNITSDDNFQQEFFDLVNDLDLKFKVCGYPVRFTANGPDVHDW